MIVTSLDLFTSLMAATTIFGILGNLAYESGSDDISTVVRAGTGLAFVSYPEALARFTVVPQLFAVLFFLMLFVLGIGTNVALCNAVISVIKDQFPQLQQWKIAAGFSVFAFSIGIVYCTPVSIFTLSPRVSTREIDRFVSRNENNIYSDFQGGQYILNLVDYFGGTFAIVLLASCEIIAISWVYGDNFTLLLLQKPRPRRVTRI